MTSAIELSDPVRRADFVLVGSIVSSLDISALQALAALRQPFCRLLIENPGSFAFYFSLYFNDKRNPAACDVRFVPNVFGMAAAALI